MASIEEIVQLAPIPAIRCAIDSAWDDVEIHYGVPFPADFKILLSTYGRGVFQPCGVLLSGFKMNT